MIFRRHDENCKVDFAGDFKEEESVSYGALSSISAPLGSLYYTPARK